MAWTVNAMWPIILDKQENYDNTDWLMAAKENAHNPLVTILSFDVKAADKETCPMSSPEEGKRKTNTGKTSTILHWNINSICLQAIKMHS